MDRLWRLPLKNGAFTLLRVILHLTLISENIRALYQPSIDFPKRRPELLRLRTRLLQAEVDEGRLAMENWPKMPHCVQIDKCTVVIEFAPPSEQERLDGVRLWLVLNFVNLPNLL